MRILYLCHRIPYPPNKGDKIRSFNEVRYLATRHEVDLLCLADEPGDLKYRADLQKLCANVAIFPLNPTCAKLRGGLSLLLGRSISVGYFHQRDMQDCFNRWLYERNYDAIVCFSSTMAEYLFNGRLPADRPRLIMDFCDVDSDKWLQYAARTNFPMNWAYRLENRRLADYEQRVSRAFDYSVLISEAEAALFQQVCPESAMPTVIPNGVDYEYFDPWRRDIQVSKADVSTLIFTGAMDYHANVDGVVWFCREIWPVLKKEFSDLRFTIVGSKPVAMVQKLAALDGVTVTGFVDDVRPYYKMADICVIPLRLARGVQNKVLEAMAMGKAVVATTKANAGILATPGEHLKVADTEKDFVEVITALLRDKEQRLTLGQNARKFVVARHDWANNMKKMEQLLL